MTSFSIRQFVFLCLAFMLAILFGHVLAVSLFHVGLAIGMSFVAASWFAIIVANFIIGAVWFFGAQAAQDQANSSLFASISV